MSDSLPFHWLQHTRLPCPPQSLWVCSNSCPLSQGCYLTISSCHLLLGHLALTHGPKIPGSYAVLFFTALDLTSIIRHIYTWGCFCSGPATSFFLELLVLALCSSQGAYWTPSGLRASSSGVISFGFFILFMGFSRQENWSGLPFPPPVGHGCLHYDLSVLGGPA